MGVEEVIEVKMGPMGGDTAALTLMARGAGEGGKGPLGGVTAVPGKLRVASEGAGGTDRLLKGISVVSLMALVVFQTLGKIGGQEGRRGGERRIVSATVPETPLALATPTGSTTILSTGDFFLATPNLGIGDFILARPKTR